MDRRAMLHDEKMRLYARQRARISRLDSLGILGIAFLAVVMFDRTPALQVWTVVMISQVVAGSASELPYIPTRLARGLSWWWVSGASGSWAALPLITAGAAEEPLVAWILVFILVYGLASDAVYLPQTYDRNLVPVSIAFSLPYAFVFVFHGHWGPLFAVAGSLFHMSWGARGTVDLVRDLIEQRVDAELERNRAHDRAYRDSLTGSLTRDGLVDHLGVLVARTHSDDINCVFVDLDDFKALNDNFGYLAGDRTLQAFCGQLAAALPDGWVVGRFGGDEFVAVGANGDLGAIAEGIGALEVVPEVAWTVSVDVIRASVGAVQLAAAGLTAEELFLHASAALREAKAAGKNTVVISDADLRAKQARRRRLGHDVERGLADGEFTPFAQPLVDLATRRIVSIELLARWRRRDEFVLPHEFMPLIEATGRVGELDELMLDRGVRIMGMLAERGHDGLGVAVNVCPSQLGRASLPDTLDALATRHGVSLSGLKIEVTESAELGRRGLEVDVADRLRAMGVRLSIDDFGTGYSSISRLLALPFSEVKLDLSLVQQAGEAGADDLLRALAEFGDRNGLTVVAEGIETEEQLAVVLGLGIGVGQGYLFSRPVDLTSLFELLDAERGHGVSDLAA